MTHPYEGLAPHRHWRRGIENVPMADVDPVVSFPFKLGPADKVATAGSCFAQHIARHLEKNGFNYYVVEKPHEIMWRDVARDTYGYGVFSARYGNIYTSRQLVQLFDRSFGTFTPKEDIWRGAKGEFIDPFRPTIEPDGFASEYELRASRAHHLAQTRSMFETLDCFVFTLGLTECWYSKADGAVFPVAPGVSGGDYDPERHGFLNLPVSDVTGDLIRFVNRLKRVNPKARIILTVSPVPLVATAEDRHVLVSTTLSKSVLRVAADNIVRRFDHVAYFPSYEIITGNYSRGAYYAEDLRSVVEAGVEHVMRLFMRHATAGGAEQASAPAAEVPRAPSLRDMQEIVQTLCDEERINAAL